METFFARSRVIVGLLGFSLAACHRDPAPETPASQTAETSASTLTPRQWVMSKLVDQVILYRLATGQMTPTPSTRYVPLSGVTRKTYPNRAAERADINRLIDSLQATGPMEDFGRPGTMYDTLPPQTPAVTLPSH